MNTSISILSTWGELFSQNVIDNNKNIDNFVGTFSHTGTTEKYSMYMLHRLSEIDQELTGHIQLPEHQMIFTVQTKRSSIFGTSAFVIIDFKSKRVFFTTNGENNPISFSKVGNRIRTISIMWLYENMINTKAIA